MNTPTLKELVAQAKETMRCNCDLDNWEPERDTGHSHVCRIHQRAKAQFRANREASPRQEPARD
jgi:hypothetical protein